MRSCEVGGCPNYGATAMDACGTVYVCDSCRALIDSLRPLYAPATGGELA